jgi:iron complex outermembrane receptor protein
MKHHRTIAPSHHYTIRTVVRVALTAGLAAAVGIPLGAPAQPAKNGQKAANLGKVMVTGSRIKRTSIVTAQPITHITQQDIKNSGLKTIGQLLDRLPQVGFVEGLASGSFTGTGAERVDLRYLGSQRLLVLLNGKRLVKQFGGSADLNQIPLAIIDHIEVLQDGASATYGSDAIAGVINLITKKNLNGGEASAYYGIANGPKTGDWDGQTQQYNVVLGKSGDWGHFLIDGSYLAANAIPAPDRFFSGENPVLGPTRGGVATPQGTFDFYAPGAGSGLTKPNPPAASTGLTSQQCPDVSYSSNGQTYYIPHCFLTVKKGTSGKNPSDFRPFTNHDRYIEGPLQIPITINQDIKNIYAEGNYNLTPSVSIDMNVLYNRRQSIGPRNPDLIFLSDPGLTIPADNRYNPFGFELATSDPVQVAPGLKIPTLNAAYRSTFESGRRMRDFSVTTFRFEGGLSGNFNLGPTDWDWDASYLYSTYNNQSAEGNLSNDFTISLATSPLCDQIAGCVPLNIFGGQGVNGTGSWTPAMVNYENLKYGIFNLIEKDFRDIQGNISSSDIYDLPGGPLGIAAGYEHRNISGRNIPGLNFRLPSRRRTTPSQILQGGYNVDALYGELNIPIVSKLPGADYLGVDAATRWSDYSTFGSTVNSKVGVKYQPVEDLVLRASYSEGFRAGDISDLFSPAHTSYPYLTDPCSDYTAPGTRPAVAKNCKAQGVPGNFKQLQGQLTTITSGNQNLNPETSISKTLGFVYSPSQIPGLNVSVDYYHIHLKNTIASIGASSELLYCYRQSVQKYCNKIHRGAGGTINEIDVQTTNIGQTKTAGIDFDINYKLPSTPFGDFRVQLYATHVNFYETLKPRPDGTTASTSAVGNLDYGNIPSWRELATLDYDYGPWHAALIGHYFSGFTGSCTDAKDNTPISLTNLGFCTDPNYKNNSLSTNHRAALAWMDVHLSYTTPWNVTISGGVNNILGKTPAGGATGYGQDSALDYGVFSRFLYGQVTYDF